MQATRGACITVGFLIAAFPALDNVVGLSYRILALVPLLFAGVLIGLYFATGHGAYLQHNALVGASIGVLVMLGPTILLVQSGPKPVVGVFIIGVPAVVGFAVFTLFVAYLLWSAPDTFVPRWISVALVVAPIVDPLVNAIITPILAVGISITGLSWIGVGLTLCSGDDADDSNAPIST